MPGRPPPAAKAGRERRHRLLLEFVDRAARVAVGGQDQIRQRLGRLLRIVAVDGRGRDRQVDELALPVDRRGDKATASRSLDLGLGEFGLRRHQLALHRRSRLEELLHIKLATRLHATLHVPCGAVCVFLAARSLRHCLLLAAPSVLRSISRAYGLRSGGARCGRSPATSACRPAAGCHAGAAELRAVELLDDAAAEFPLDQVGPGQHVGRRQVAWRWLVVGRARRRRAAEAGRSTRRVEAPRAEAGLRGRAVEAGGRGRRVEAELEARALACGCDRPAPPRRPDQPLDPPDPPAASSAGLVQRRQAEARPCAQRPRRG